jgi:hypothetical protein
MSNNIYLTSASSKTFLTKAEADKLYASSLSLANYLPLGGGTIRTNTDALGSFQVQNSGGNGIFFVDTNGPGGVRTGGQYIILSSGDTAVQPATTGTFYVQPGGSGNKAIDVSGSIGSTTLRNRTDSANAFQVQNNAGQEVMGIDTVGTGATRFKNNGGSTVLNIANRATAGGSAITTFNNTLDSGTGDMLVKTTTNSANAFRIQSSTSTNVISVSTTNNLTTINRWVNFPSTVPTVTSTVGTATISGSNMSGRVQLVTTASIAANTTLCTVTFGAGTWPSATFGPVVNVTSANQTAGPFHVYISASSTTSWSIASHAAIPNPGTYQWNFHILGN